MKDDELVEGIRGIAIENPRLAKILAAIAGPDIEEAIQKKEAAHQANIHKWNRKGYEKSDAKLKKNPAFQDRRDKR